MSAVRVRLRSGLGARRRGSIVNWRALAGNGAVMSAVTFGVLFFIWFWYSPGGIHTVDINDLSTLTTTLALGAFGTTIVVVVGDFDLSIAGVISVVNAYLAAHLASGGGVLPAIVLCLAIGLGVGLINGFLVTVIRVESMAATLATLILLTGVALLILNMPGGTVPTSLSTPLTAVVGGVPVAAMILAGLAIIWLILRRTTFGVGLFAVGQDEEAARMSGVKTRRTKLIAFVLAGLCYALSGIYLSAVTGTGDPAAGQPFLLQSFVAVALGGASLQGGRGSAVGTVLGALVLTMIPKVLFVLGVADFWSGVIQGCVLVGAVVLGLSAARLARGRLRRSATLAEQADGLEAARQGAR